MPETSFPPNTNVASPSTAESVDEEGHTATPLLQGHAEEKDRRGRPSTFKAEIGQNIIAGIRARKSVPVAAEHAGVPSSTVYHWLSQGEQAAEGPLKEFAVGVRQAQADVAAADVPPIMEPRPLGRPTDCVPEVWHRMVELVRLGNSLEIASETVGVPFSTARGWRKRGERESDGPYREFALALRKARVGLAIRSNALLNKAANAGSVAAAKYLHQLAGGLKLVDRAEEEEEFVPFEIPDLEEPEG